MFLNNDNIQEKIDPNMERTLFYFRRLRRFSRNYETFNNVIHS